MQQVGLRAVLSSFIYPVEVCVGGGKQMGYTYNKRVIIKWRAALYNVPLVWATAWSRARPCFLFSMWPKPHEISTSQTFSIMFIVVLYASESELYTASGPWPTVLNMNHRPTWNHFFKQRQLSIHYQAFHAQTIVYPPTGLWRGWGSWKLTKSVVKAGASCVYINTLALFWHSMTWTSSSCYW